ncbi:putative aminodeoxychorismate lyase, D-amino-acid transaminase [Dioscorea sansibarensis]
MNGSHNFANGSGEENYVDFHVPVYSSSEVVERLSWRRTTGEQKPYKAMYSSLIGGITLDQALMVIPIDDHMVHRGHGVFDTTMIMNGYLYDLDSHLDRFLKSALNAKISPPYPSKTLRNILVQLVAASKCKKGSIRFWLSAGPGNFLLTFTGSAKPIFYAVVIEQNLHQLSEGVKIITSSVPIKPSKFATMKNVNYLPNVFAKMEAEEEGVYSSIWIDEKGYVAEGPNANVAFISNNKELVFPLSDKILEGCTSKRLQLLAQNLVEKGVLKSVCTRHITLKEAKNSAEMMYVSSLLPILPIIEWDKQRIGDGMVGELTMILSDLMWEDINSGPEARRICVPYNLGE